MPASTPPPRLLAVLLCALAFAGPALSAENGATCRAGTCRIEGPGGETAKWVMKMHADRKSGLHLVTRAFTGRSPAAALERYRNGGNWPVGLCASACSITAAIADSVGALEAAPRSVFCWCHDNDVRDTLFGSQLPARWLRLLRTGEPFYYREVGK